MQTGSLRRGLTRALRRRIAPWFETGAWRHPTWPARSIDRLVVSFPKSGRTWLRVLLAGVEAERTRQPLEKVAADWLRRDAPELAGRPVLFTHALASSHGEPLQHVAVFLSYVADRARVFLVRDPRDAVVSYYFQQVKRRGGDWGDVPDGLSAFARHPFYGVDRIVGLLNASQRAFESGSGPALIVSYEALHAEPVVSLARVLRFLGAGEVAVPVLERAVEFARFDNMRKLEERGALSGRLRPADPNDPESFKTRKGRVGGYREYFDGEDVAWIESRIQNGLVAAMGYATPGAAPAIAERAARP